MTPEIAATVAKHPKVQLLEIYHPFLKAAVVDRFKDEEQYVLVQLAEAPGLETAIKEVTEILGAATDIKNRGGFYLSGNLRVRELARLLHNPLVVGVHQVTA